MGRADLLKLAYLFGPTMLVVPVLERGPAEQVVAYAARQVLANNGTMRKWPNCHDKDSAR